MNDGIGYRIAAALERIADALEKQVPPPLPMEPARATGSGYVMPVRPTPFQLSGQPSSEGFAQ